MINKGLPYVPPMKEVVAAADLFDQMGDFESAALLDEYIERTAEADGDIVKLAGFWANVWKRMKGRAKMWFYSEYKELYNAAKEAQEKIQERIGEAEKAIHELKKDVKNHDLQDWRLKLDEMDILNTADITAPFDRIYGRFLAYILKFKDQQEKGEKIGPLTPSEKVERMTGSETTRGMDWISWDKKKNQLLANRARDMIKIEKGSAFDKAVVPVKGKPGYWKVWDRTILESLKAIMGGSMWELVREDSKYVYYKEVSAQAEEPKIVTKEPSKKSEPPKSEPPKKPEPPKGKDFPPPSLPPIPTGPKKEPEPATGILTDEEETLEKELTGGTSKPVEPKEEKPVELPKAEPEKPETAAPEAEKPAVSRKKQGAQKVWTELVGGSSLKKLKVGKPTARLFTYMQRKSLTKNHRELDPKDEKDLKIIATLEMQGPEAKKTNKYIRLFWEQAEKTASGRKVRLGKLMSLISE